MLLDPFPFGGGVTSLEAFGLCKAVVTLPSVQSVPKLTAGMIKMMNITSKLIAANEDEYVEVVIRLLENEEYRKSVETQICENDHLLYSQKPVVDEWESVFRRVVKNLD